jgi:hypothetical protein
MPHERAAAWLNVIGGSPRCDYVALQMGRHACETVTPNLGRSVRREPADGDPISELSMCGSRRAVGDRIGGYAFESRCSASVLLIGSMHVGGSGCRDGGLNCDRGRGGSRSLLGGSRARSGQQTISRLALS